MVTSAPIPSAADWQAWRVDPAWSRFVDVPAAEGGTHCWHVLDRRPADAIGTVVCVHGNPTWSVLWRDLIERVGDRYRVIAVDQLGMGWSDRPGPRTYAQRVADLAAVIDALEIEGPLVVAGHDWGGAVSMGWAVDAGDRVAGMILCNTGIAVPAGRRAPWLIRLAASGPLTDAACRRTRVFVDGTLALSLGRLDRPTRQALRAPYRSADRRASIADFVADVPFTDDHRSAADLARVAASLSDLTCPVLLTWGARDPVFDDSFANDLATRMPHADRHRFATAGHLSPIEQGVDVAGTVDAWLRARVEGAATPAAASSTTGQSAGERSPVAATAWSALERRRTDASVAFVDGATGSQTSFGELCERVMGAAAGLHRLGVQPGDRVAVLVPPGPDLLAAVYAIWRAGAVTVIADRGLGLRGLGRAVRGAHVRWIVGPPAAIAVARAARWAPRARAIVLGSRRVLGATPFEDLVRDSGDVPPAPGEDAPAAVLWTSGATGPAKGVRYTHGQLLAQADAIARTYGITEDDRLVAAFAPFALYGPVLGIASAIPDVDVTRPGSLTADALEAAAASIDATIVFASPAALANVVATSTGELPALSRVRLVLSAGAPVPVDTLRSMAVRAPVATLHTPYGMTECLPVADISLDQIAAIGPGRGVCVGRPVAGASVRISPLRVSAPTPDRGSAGAIPSVPAGVTGEVLVRAPWRSAGYDQLFAIERDARPTGDDGVTWHRSGDVGHLDADGRLWIEGRSVHVIDHADGPVTPVPVEVAVERLDGVARCAAVGVGPAGRQQLVVVVEDVGRDAGLAGEAVAAAVRAAVDHPVSAVLTVRALPVDIRHNTKIDRLAVARWASRVLSGARDRPRW